MRRYSFIKLDVFTRRPLQGNQLAVLTDARGLTSAQMQALAREMRQRDPQFGVTHSPEAVARALALPVSALDSRFPVQTVSTGVPFTIVPLASLETLRTIAFDFRRADEYMQTSDAKFFYLVCRQTEDPATTLRARMIFYSGEDPATGSAAACAAAWMVAHAILAPEKQVLIEQGVEMKRPSLIYVRAGKTGDRIHDVRVGGHVDEIMRGTVAF